MLNMIESAIHHIQRHPLTILSAFVCALLVFGVINRRRKSIHVPAMLSAFAIDLGMVVYLEARRGVVESIPHRHITPLLIFHIVISVIVLVLYSTQTITGFKRLRGDRGRAHRLVPWVLIPLRMLNFVTSIMVTQG
jgi:uncharacterized membrane protein YozB (DUF420 family)